MPTPVRSSAYLCAFTVLRPPYSNHYRVSTVKIGRAVAVFGSGVSSVTAGCCGMRPRCRPLCAQAIFQPFPCLCRQNWMGSGCFWVWSAGVSSVRAGCCGMRPRCRPLCTQALICAHSQCFALHIPTIPESLLSKLDEQWLLLGLECPV
jgi:hypothetical protein